LSCLFDPGDQYTPFHEEYVTPRIDAIRNPPQRQQSRSEQPAKPPRETSSDKHESSNPHRHFVPAVIPRYNIAQARKLNGLGKAQQDANRIETRLVVDERSAESDDAKGNAAQRQHDKAELLDAERGGDVCEKVHGVVQAGADVEAVRA